MSENERKNPFEVLDWENVNHLFKQPLDKIISDYGEITRVGINPKKHNIQLDVLLKGEKENISISLDNYEIIHENDSYFIKFENYSASREWVQVLMQHLIFPIFIPKNIVEIHPEMAEELAILLDTPLVPLAMLSRRISKSLPVKKKKKKS